MLKTYANFGSGPDIKKSTKGVRWINFDRVLQSSEIGSRDFHVWDMTEDPQGQMEHSWIENFDRGVLNHVLCTMNDYSAHRVLINIHRMLKPGASLIVIDMNILEVFKSYQEGRVEDIPIKEGSIDDRLCFAISGYGTRLSLYTPERMRKVLEEAGFRVVEEMLESEYDTRVNESLVFRATK
jgi:SAM-dependent methyltransferase